MADLRITDLPVANIVLNDDVFYVIQEGFSRQLSAANLYSYITDATLRGNLGLDPNVELLDSNTDYIINPDITRTNFVVDSFDSQYAYLYDGYEGQIKVLSLSNTYTSANGGQSGTVILDNSNANIAGNTVLTFARPGDTSILMFSGNSWLVLGTTPGFRTNKSGSTDDLQEGSNLYFTSQRSRNAISAGDSTIIYDSSTGQIRANVGFLANIDISTFSTNNLPEGNSNLYFTVARVSNAVQPDLANLRADIERPMGNTIFVSTLGDDNRNGLTMGNAVANIHTALSIVQSMLSNTAYTYNKTKCRRDTRLIVDSIAFDLAYEGNTQSTFAGLQYYAQSSSAIPTQSEETIAAINYIKTITANVILNSNVANTYLYGSNVSRTSGTASNANVLTMFNTNYDLVANIIQGGTVGVTDRIVPNGFPAKVEANILNAANLIIANKQFIQEQTVGYIKSTYPGFFSNANNFIDVANAETKCYRDTGYILDTVLFDVKHGGNRQSIQSGVYYYNFNANVSQINEQVVQTGAAYNFIKSVIPFIVTANANGYVELQSNVAQNTLAATAATLAEANTVSNVITIITDIISLGPNVAPTKQPIGSNLSSNSNVVNAAKLILANREFITEEVIRFVDTTYPDFGSEANVRPSWYSIRVASGEYTLWGNPLTIPARTSLLGADLRTTTIYPENPTDDMFYVNNGIYINGFTFRGHLSPAAVVAYNPDGSAGVISTSPYVQNCSSITSTGTGMRVNGSHVLGLKSMVLDAFTQTNSGGIGVHMLNRGYTQLVSLFTICCNISVLAESGGFCSITNSNSSFGTYGLVADGVSVPLYSGKVISNSSGRSWTITNLTQRPNIGDAVLFANYNQAKCSRDTGLIVDSLALDLAFTSNTQSSFAGLQYFAQAESEIPGQAEETVAALNYAKVLATNVVINLGQASYYQATNNQIYANASPGNSYTSNLIGSEFDLITGIIQNGTVGITDQIIPNEYPANTNPSVLNAANLIQSNKTFIASEVLAYVNNTYPSFTYDSNLCFRDVGYILDSITFDLRYTGNRQAITSGVYYYNYNANVTQINNQVVQTGAAYEYIKTMMPAIVTANSNAYTRLQTVVSQNTTAAPAATLSQYLYVSDSIDLITTIISDGPSAAPTKRPIELTANTNANVINATKLIISNRDFIRAEVLEYVNRNWANISNGTVDFYSVDSSTNLIANTATVTLLTRYIGTMYPNVTVSFHQPSYISASGHTFEYVGAGNELATALPYAGGVPIQENEVVETRGGAVYYTSTDHLGDFRIGNELLFQRATGTINGRTFNKSLFAVMTPYILALES